MLKTLLILSGLFAIQCTLSQTPPDSLFKQARDAASRGHVDSSETIIRALHTLYPKNEDYTIYYARVESWQEKYREAIALLEPLADREPPNQEALMLLTIQHNRATNSEKALHYAGIGVATGENPVFYRFQEATALGELGRTKEALKSLDFIESDTLNHSVEYLRTSLLKQQKNMVSGGYFNTSFSDPGFAPWHFAHVEYKRNYRPMPWIIRTNYGRLYTNSGIQVEAEAYPQLNKRTYLYTNVGLAGNSKVFPGFRAGAELYHSIRNYAQFSGGLRFLHFATEEVFIYSLSASLIRGPYKLTYHPYLANQGGEWYATHVLNLRFTNELNESYFQFDLQYGTLPYYYLTSTGFTRLNALRAGFQYRFRIHYNWFLQPVFMYELEEYVPVQTRNKFNVQLIIARRF